MWQKLLADRFGLVVHHESREFEVDELVVARGGHKLKPTATTEPIAEGPKRVENGKLVGQGLANLVPLLSSQLGHPVVDKTGLTGRYDFKVEFATKPYPGMPAAPLTPSDPTLDLGAAVQQQLGLRLEKGQAPLDMIVVDRAEKVPTEN